MRTTLFMLLLIVASATALCEARDTMPKTSAMVVPSDTLVRDTSQTGSAVTPLTFTTDEMNTNLMRESDKVNATPSAFDKYLVWSMDHILLTALIYTALVLLLLWLVYRVIYYFI